MVRSEQCLWIAETTLNIGNYEPGTHGAFMDPDETDANGEKRYTSRQTSRHIIYDGEPYETYHTDKGKLYLAMQREYGRCEGFIYVDGENGEPKRVGWHFIKKQEYEDSGRYGREKQFYKQETWVVVHSAAPTKTVTFHYAAI